MAANKRFPGGMWWAAYLLACLPMAALIAECARGAYCDVQLIRTAALRTEVGTLRVEASRGAVNLEAALNIQGNTKDWKDVRNEPWMGTLWSEVGKQTEHQAYAAVVDGAGAIVMHSDPEFVDKSLGWNWYDKTVSEAGDDVVRSRGSLSAGEAYDVRVPLVVHGKRVGDYHAGLDAEWFDGQTASLEHETLRKWLGIMGWAVATVIAGGWGLCEMARRERGLSQKVQDQSREQGTQLARIASGLAHEVRNPLHAVRINLHTLRRATAGKSQLSPQDLEDTIRQSDLAIDSIEGLLRDFLQFATPQDSQRAEVNVANEIQATLNLMGDEMRRKQIQVLTSLPEESVCVSIDPGRLRQMLVNLLTFAENRTAGAGTIEVGVTNGSSPTITIADYGPALSEIQEVQAFEPFDAPGRASSGLGMALVKSIAEEAGGSVRCERKKPTGCRVQIFFPAVSSMRRIPS